MIDDSMASVLICGGSIAGPTLAWWLHQHGLTPEDHAAAFARYEEKMRRFVVQNQAIVELTRDERLSDPDYYTGVIEPALEKAKNAIVLEGLA